MKGIGPVKTALQSILHTLESCALKHKLSIIVRHCFTQPRVLAVSKTKSPELIMEAYDAGQREFGQNYIQEFVDKAKQLPEDIKWHMIGHVQSNKAKLLLSVPNLYMLETLDTPKLASKVNGVAAKQDRILKVLVQVITSDEGTKSGVSPSDVEQLVEFVLSQCAHLEFCGLMTMGKVGDIESFKLMQSLLESLRERFESLKDKELELSMGTSQDYELATQFGATQVRVGSTIFGARQYAAKKVVVSEKM